jgi:hypothetical protein
MTGITMDRAMTMTIDKPARLITRLTKALREREAEIAQLKKLIYEAVVHAEDRLRVAHDQRIMIGEARVQSDHREARIVELDALNTKACNALDVLHAEHAAALELVEVQRALIAELDANWDAVVACLGLDPGSRSCEAVCDSIAVHRENSRTLATLSKERAIVDEQRAALAHILDGVRSRMRRRELEEERAVLNRKALTAAVPERNVR